MDDRCVSGSEKRERMLSKATKRTASLPMEPCSRADRSGGSAEMRLGKTVQDRRFGGLYVCLVRILVYRTKVGMYCCITINPHV